MLIMQTAAGYMMSAALHTVTRLGVADQLASGPLAVAELAKRTHANPDALYRVLRPLIAAGIFAETSPKTITLTPASDFLRADHPNSIRDMILWVDSRFHYEVWADLEHSVRTGTPAVEHIYGKPCFAVFGDKPEVSETFNAGMTSLSSKIAPAVLEAYDFSRIGTLMDVAGGHGFVLCEILRAYPHMKGILFDVESVIEGAKCRVCDLKMDHRCETLTGDFFESIPMGADAYYLQHIIHDWPDDKALVILNNCRRALAGRKDGKLLVVDSVLTERPSPQFGNLLDLEMLLMPGGRERTEKEFRELFARAGFETTRVISMKASDSIIEAVLKG
jgi:hypothetical protein